MFLAGFDRRAIAEALRAAPARRLADLNVTDTERRAVIRLLPAAALELERTQIVPRDLEDTFAFFADPWNLEAITPPWLRFRILEAPAQLRRCARLRYRLRLFAVPIVWRTEISDWRPPRTFTDTQIAGPYPSWVHTHRFCRVPGGTELYDHVRYRLPGGRLAPAVERLFVRGWLDAIFDFRARRLAQLLGSE